MPVATRWRLLYRLPWLVVHLLLSLPLAVVAQNVWLRDYVLGAYTVEDRVVRWWCGGLLRIFGIRLSLFGELNRGPVLVVANHISWLDIVALLSLRMLRFVAKEEIRRWPLVGRLVTRARTVYVRRGNSNSAYLVLHHMTAQLSAGQTVAIFPEGGIPDEEGVARFRSRLLQSAIDAGVAVEPIGLRYRVAGRLDKTARFGRGEPFIMNFIRLLAAPPRNLELVVLPRLESAGKDRRELAAESERQVRAAYQAASPSAVVVGMGE